MNKDTTYQKYAQALETELTTIKADETLTEVQRTKLTKQAITRHETFLRQLCINFNLAQDWSDNYLAIERKLETLRVELEQDILSRQLEEKILNTMASYYAGLAEIWQCTKYTTRYSNTDNLSITFSSPDENIYYSCYGVTGKVVLYRIINNERCGKLTTRTLSELLDKLQDFNNIVWELWA